jgi:tRNA (adenine57-N1/adenine58-N1)-methyltransferase
VSDEDVIASVTGESGEGDSEPGRFVEGDRALLIDRKGRKYLVRLRSGRTFQSHAGIVAHDAVIGASEGAEVEARMNDGARRTNARYLAVRPTLADVVLNMPRGAQVIYPVRECSSQVSVPAPCR